MQVIVSLTSPFARKIRVILLEKGLSHVTIKDAPHEPNARVGDVNPLGKVPALIADNGEVFFDSPVIADYLETLGAAPFLLPPDRLAAVRVKQIEAIADGVLDAAVLVLLEGRRPAEQQNDAWRNRHWGKAIRGLSALNALAEGKTWLMGGQFSLADIAVATTYAWVQFRFPGYEIESRHPALARWAAPILERPSFQATIPVA